VPTYSYACTECEHRFDTVQSFTDSTLTDCPECRGRLRKLFSSVGIVFKGSGFYRTDSRSAPDSGRPSESGAKSGAESGSAAKPESGAAAKSESESSASGAKPGSGSATSGAKVSSTASSSARAAAS
jgi:putative FmdB family regulatory protein